jgi:tetratricopeptide (TPR) repeat protein
MGAVEYAAGNRVAAENCFRRATENDAGSARAHGMLAWALWDLGRYDEAVAATHDAARLEPGSFYWHQNLAIMSGDLGQLPEALRESRIASQLAPNRTWEAVARNNRAYLLAYAGRLPEALTEATAALALNPQDPAVHDTAGLMYALSGQLGPAERHLRHALAAGYPSLPKLAYVLALRGDASGAREMLRSARSNLIGPLASMDALFPAGLAYDLLGEPDVTMRIFRQTAGLRPRHPWSAPMREYLARG